MTQAIGKDMSDFDTVRNLLIRFRDERNWRQFHTLKNLIISLNLEAAELLELTQWKTDEELARLTSDAGFSEQLRDECADVFLYLLLIAGEGGFDLLQAAQEKIAKNARRYPVEQAYGSAKKYTELKQAARRAEEN
jgi:NTP pyrophosphatase (non-canonical NTP hydrolase)